MMADKRFTMGVDYVERILEGIHCPSVLKSGENDPMSLSAAVFERLKPIDPQGITEANTDWSGKECSRTFVSDDLLSCVSTQPKGGKVSHVYPEENVKSDDMKKLHLGAVTSYANALPCKNQVSVTSTNTVKKPEKNFQNAVESALCNIIPTINSTYSAKTAHIYSNSNVLSLRDTAETLTKDESFVTLTLDHVPFENHTNVENGKTNPGSRTQFSSVPYNLKKEMLKRRSRSEALQAKNVRHVNFTSVMEKTSFPKSMKAVTSCGSELMMNMINSMNAISNNCQSYSKASFAQRLSEINAKCIVSPENMHLVHDVPRKAIIGRNVADLYFKPMFPASNALKAAATSSSSGETRKRKHSCVSDSYVRYLNKPKRARHEAFTLIFKQGISVNNPTLPSPTIEKTKNNRIPWPSDKTPLEGCKIRKHTQWKFASPITCRKKSSKLSKYRIPKPKRKLPQTPVLKTIQMNNNRLKATGIYKGRNMIDFKNRFVSTDKYIIRSVIDSSRRQQFSKKQCFAFPSESNYLKRVFNKVHHKPNLAVSFAQNFNSKTLKKNIPKSTVTFDKLISSSTKFPLKVSPLIQRVRDIKVMLKCVQTPEPLSCKTSEDYVQVCVLFQVRKLFAAKALKCSHSIGENDEQKQSKNNSGWIQKKLTAQLYSAARSLCTKEKDASQKLVLVHSQTEQCLMNWAKSLPNAERIDAISNASLDLAKEGDKTESTGKVCTANTMRKSEWLHSIECNGTLLSTFHERAPSSDDNTSQSQVFSAWLHDDLDSIPNVPVVSSNFPTTPETHFPAMSPQRNFDHKPTAVKNKGEYGSVNESDDVPVHTKDTTDPVHVSKTLQTQTKVKVLPKEEGCTQKRKRSRPQPSYCVRFRSHFYSTDCFCDQKNYWIDCPINKIPRFSCKGEAQSTQMKINNACVSNHCHDPTTKEDHLNDNSIPNGILENDSPISGSNIDHISGDMCNSCHNSVDDESCDKVPPNRKKLGNTQFKTFPTENGQGDIFQVQREENKPLSSNKYNLTNNSYLKPFCEEINSEMLEKQFGKSIEELARIAWLEDTFLHIPSKAEDKFDHLCEKKDKERDNRPQKSSKGGKEADSVISQRRNLHCLYSQGKYQIALLARGEVWRKMDDDCVSFRDGNVREVLLQTKKKGNEPCLNKLNCLAPVSEYRFNNKEGASGDIIVKERRSLSLPNKPVKTQGSSSAIGCFTNSNVGHMCVTQVEQKSKPILSHSLIGQLDSDIVVGEKDMGNLFSKGNVLPDIPALLPTHIEFAGRQSKVTEQNEVNVKFNSSLTKTKSDSNFPLVKMGRDRNLVITKEKSYPDLEGLKSKNILNLPASEKCLTVKSEAENSKEKMVDDVETIPHEPTNDDAKQQQQEENVNSSEVRSSHRLRSRKGGTKRGRYEEDYVTDIPPKNAKKPKKSLPSWDYDQDEFWEFYRNCQDSDHSKNLILQHKYIKFFKDKEINCKVQTFSYGSQNYTCAVPSIQYANSSIRPKPTVPADGFLPFMEHFTTKSKSERLKLKKDGQCPFCGRQFGKESEAKLEAHITRHNMGPWNILSAPRLPKKKKKKKPIRHKSDSSIFDRHTASQTTVLVEPSQGAKKDPKMKENKLASKSNNPTLKSIPFPTSLQRSVSTTGVSSDLDQFKNIKAFPRPSHISMGHRKQTARKSHSNLAVNLPKATLIAALKTASYNNGRLPMSPIKGATTTIVVKEKTVFKPRNTPEKIAPGTKPKSSTSKLSFVDALNAVSPTKSTTQHKQLKPKAVAQMKTTTQNNNLKSEKALNAAQLRLKKRSIGLSKYAKEGMNEVKCKPDASCPQWKNEKPSNCDKISANKNCTSDKNDRKLIVNHGASSETSLKDASCRSSPLNKERNHVNEKGGKRPGNNGTNVHNKKAKA